MRRILIVVVSVVLVLVSSSQIKAQWEQVGWPGGTIQPVCQSGHTLIGLGGYSYYRSLDWGKTWTPFNDGLPSTSFVNKGIFAQDGKFYIVINSYSSNSGLVNSFAGSIYYVSESDTKWEHIVMSPINGVYPRPNQLVIISPDSLAVLPLVGDRNIDGTNGCYFSSNGGKNWELRMSGLPVVARDCYLGYEKPLMVFFCTTTDSASSISTKRKFASSDFGKTWIEKNPYGDSVGYDVWFRNDRIWLTGIYNGTSTVIKWSEDSAKTWTPVNAPWKTDPTLYGVRRIYEVDGILFASTEMKTSPMYAVYASYDNGKNWQRLSLPLSMYPYYAVYGDKSYYMFNTSSTQYVSTDSTFVNFSPINFQPSYGYPYAQLLYAADTKIYSSTIFAYPIAYRDSLFDSINVSYDNGSNWSRQEFSKDYLFHAVSQWYKGAGKVYTTGKNKHTSSLELISSTDEGTTWNSELVLPNPHLTKVLIVIGDSIVLQEIVNPDPQDPTIVFTINHGLNWDTLLFPKQEVFFLYSSVNIFENNSIDRFEIHAAPNNLVSLTAYENSDIGYSWQKVVDSSLLPANQVRNVAHLGKNFFVTTYKADKKNSNSKIYTVFVTADAGGHWSKAIGLDSNFNCSPVYSENGRLFAATLSDQEYDPKFEGRVAIYDCTDGGFNWHLVGDYIPMATEIYSGSEYIYASSKEGLWRYPKSQLDVSPRPRTSSLTDISNCVPNPASNECRVQYSIAKEGRITLSAYDITGRVRGMVVDKSVEAGNYDFHWDTTTLPSGTYILRLNSAGETISKLIQIVK